MTTGGGIGLVGARRLIGTASLLIRGGAPTDRMRMRLMAVGTTLATFFLLAAANVLAVRGEHSGRYLNLVAEPGLRGGTAFALAVLVLPIAGFLYQSSRLAAATRDRRLAALRLAGATPRQVRMLGASEGTIASAIGALTGLAGYLVLQLLGRLVMPEKHPVIPVDVGLPPLLAGIAVALVVAAGTASGLLAGGHVIASPLGVTRRAPRARPRAWGLVLAAVAAIFMTAFGPLVWKSDTALIALMFGGVGLVIGLTLSVSWVLRRSGGAASRRAPTAETLLAARTIEGDPRAWGRALNVVGLVVLVGSGAGWVEASVLRGGRLDEVFFVVSFLLVDLALAFGMVVAALVVHQAESLLERRRALATLVAAGMPYPALRRAASTEAMLAATPVCVVAAALGVLAMAWSAPEAGLFVFWVLFRAALLAGLGVLATVLTVRATGPLLRRAASVEELRYE